MNPARTAAGPRLLKRGLFALLPLVLLLVGTELGFRLLWKPPTGDKAGYQLPPHPTRLWALPVAASLGPGPGDARIGPQLLRQVELTGAPLRVLTLGDSNIFGHALADRDTLHASLARSLTATGFPTDVFCGGVPGYSSEQSRVLLDEVGWDLQPDLLVVANLLSDSTEERFSDREAMAQAAQPDAVVARQLLDRSRALQWLSLRMDPPSRAEQNIGWLRPPGVVRRPRVPLDQYEENLRAIAHDAAQRQVGVIFLELATVPAFQGDPDGQAWRQAQRRVAAELGLPHVDGVQALRDAGLDADRAFIDQVHVSAAGSQAYALALSAALVDAGWPEHRLLAPE